MSPQRINEHIDNKIISKISSGSELDDIISYLDYSINKFSQRDSFINVSIKYMLNNWQRIDIKKRYNTYLVMRSYKRKSDIMQFIEKRESNEMLMKLDDISLFNLLIFKEKLKSI